jgi:tetratricopeptide (TPR) repeat protein
MTLLALLLAAAQPVQPPGPPPETEEGRAAHCQAAVQSNPEGALAAANRWRAGGGGLYAAQCLGLAYVALERWALAAATFEQAAQAADRASDARGADLWVQAGNARLAAGDAAGALIQFDTALRSRNLTPELRGEVHLDRARALVAREQLAEARAAIDQAVELVPADPMVWYLSAALARRQGDLARARTDVARARELGRDNPEILLLAGTIAGQSGDMAEAERLYRIVADRSPNSAAGRTAAESLATLREIEVATPPATTTNEVAAPPSPTTPPPPTAPRQE